MSQPPSRLKAILLALLVTFIWSTSWVLIKIGLRDIPAITFAGMRYTLAFLCLAPFLLRKEEWAQVKKFTRVDWLKLAALGVVIIALAQGGQFLGLAYLPAITVSLILNLTCSSWLFWESSSSRRHPPGCNSLEWCSILRE